MNTIERINQLLPWVSEGAREDLQQVKHDIALLLSSCRPVAWSLNRGYDVEDHDRENLSFAIKAVEGSRP